ncbi:malate:quinone oxidoreductase [Plasmodium brasilianum]|uniref:Malate:quinone oxidoreductase, putative n=2 Tax=Plasmodium (Plasmodium) TaxID=418103 RepID=A0A1A8W391_PLAMA|nr:malate:quinone oxidoreductase, putative [Plasmodium malariae]KAI4837329.1 malate:quinone oxidoreductase [Plasmodium brasilianum]SBS87250.1 malate:quinone oxidoreductase, putative (MQO) [Plasmodium malariae]SCO93211.1 malate:quinone oxidoreductase, putative [Plasmodium malariae]
MIRLRNILSRYKTKGHFTEGPAYDYGNSENLILGKRKFSSSSLKAANEKKEEKKMEINIMKEQELHNDVYDTVVIGGGVTGTALLFLLSKFTNLKKLALIERRDDYALVASHGKNNSQTIHCGDIETNYTFEKAKYIKRYADLLRNYLSNLPKEKRQDISRVTQKMVLGVGEKECQFLEDRYPIFKKLFKTMKLYNKEDIREVEPKVALKDDYTLRNEMLYALYMPPELTTCDYQKLSRSFVESALCSSGSGSASINFNYNSSDNSGRGSNSGGSSHSSSSKSGHSNNKNISINLSTEVLNIEEINDSLYKIYTSKGVIKARFVVVCACGHSLLIAQKMNYGTEYSCMPVAGSFYFTDNILNGKVYTIQNPALPFAAVHGDPDIIENGKTRFGPTALPLPLLERDNKKTIIDFLKVWNPDINLFHVYFNLFKDMTMLKYICRNFLFEIPILNKYIFLKDVRKIIPSLTINDLTYCVGYGGVRPQLINKKSRKLILGEGKIDPGKNIIFNITPSPGATTCLGNGEFDMNTICERLNATVNKDQVNKFLYQGEYPVDYL